MQEEEKKDPDSCYQNKLLESLREEIYKDKDVRQYQFQNLDFVSLVDELINCVERKRKKIEQVELRELLQKFGLDK